MFYIRRLPQALGTVLASGLLNGCFYGLTPIFAAQLGFTPAQVGQFMALSVAAGLVAQLPLGMLSDRYSRVAIIRATSILLCVAYLPLAFLNAPEVGWIMFAGAAVGFLQFCLYPLGVAHANDNLEVELRVSVAGMLLVAFGIGAAIGPLVAGTLMERLGPQGLYLFGIGVTALLTVLIRDGRKSSVSIVHASQSISTS
jgi:MFS family permease